MQQNARSDITICSLVSPQMQHLIEVCLAGLRFVLQHQYYHCYSFPSDGMKQ